MIGSGHTWGVSDPVFLLVYILLIIVVAAAVTLKQRALEDVRVPGPVGDLTNRPYDVAYLNGGAELAVTAAVSAMYAAGTVATRGPGRVAATAVPDWRADELERAIHHATALPVRRRDLPRNDDVQAALHRIDARLIDGGLLLDAERRHRIGRVALWTVALAALGAVRLVAGVAAGRSVLLLVAVVGLVALLGFRQWWYVPRRSRAGGSLAGGSLAGGSLAGGSLAGGSLGGGSWPGGGWHGEGWIGGGGGGSSGGDGGGGAGGCGGGDGGGGGGCGG